MTVTVPTPIRPIPTCLRPSRVIRITPEHPMPNPNPLAPPRANSHLSNTLPNTPTPLHLVDAFLTQCTFDLSSSLHQVNSQHPHSFPTRRSFDLSSSSRQVNSRHPHPFPTQHLSTFTLLRQVYSRRLISLLTAVGRSPIVYLPCSMRLSLSFPALYISVRSSMSHRPLPSFRFSVSSSVPCLHPPLFNLSLIYLSVDPP